MEEPRLSDKQPASPAKPDKGLRWVMAITGLPWLLLFIAWWVMRD